jgi:hypothetical protein
VNPHIAWKDLLVEPIAGDHFVQLYKEEEHLVEAVTLFAGQGLGRGHAVILVMAPAHRDAVERSLKAQDFAVQGLQRLGQLVLVDAEALLAKLMHDGMPDPELFKEAVGSLVASVSLPGRRPRVRVVGEMVHLLWASGNLPAALRLEELWNGAVAAQSLSLFCAYGLNGGGRAEFPEALCAAHSHVISGGTTLSV